MALDYKQAGVDVAAGDALVEWLRANQPKRWPHQDKLVAGIGGFAALFKADFKGYRDPCMVACTDGVGTKLKLAVHFNSYREVAQDLVAMCVNDLVCCGADPLFFLDYYACGQLRLPQAQDFLSGLRDACVASDCALIGGETAEMPGVYDGLDFDCAGFAVGVVDRERVLGASRVQDGDRIIGIGSSGFHSNGFSLLRKIFANDLEAWRDELLRPTALFVKVVQAARRHEGLRAVAHITGGGMDNVPRVLPKGMVARLQSWPVPAPFLEVKRRSGLAWRDLLGTLNCGIGMVWIVEPNQFDSLSEVIKSHEFRAFDLGTVQAEASYTDEAGWELLDPSWEGTDS